MSEQESKTIQEVVPDVSENPEEKLSEVQQLRVDLNALKERTDQLETRVSLLAEFNANKFFQTYIQPHQNLWLGVIIGLAVRFL